jgi:hypothetical protein
MCYALAILTRTTTVERSLSGINGGQWSSRHQKRKSTSPMQRKPCGSQWSRLQ